MCLKWLSEAPQHIKKVEIIFPVVGHSFLPADRVFGRIEKEFCKRDTILEPSGYSDIIKEYSSLISVGQECPVKDWKDAAKKVLKTVSTWHAPFMKCKRFILKRSKLRAGNVLVKGEVHYVADTGAYRSVCKNGKFTNMINPQDMLLGSGTLKATKIKDVNKLLNTHFDANWRSYEVLSFYDKLIPNTVQVDNVENEDENNDVDLETTCQEQIILNDLMI